MTKIAARRGFTELLLCGFLMMGAYLIYNHYQAGLTSATAANNVDWPEYNGGSNRNHYSTLDQITKENIGHLKLAWVYASGGADTTGNHTQVQCNPVIVDGTMYAVSADIQAFAVNAATGKPLWKTHITDNAGTLSRGITYFADSISKRIFLAPANGCMLLTH